MQEIMHTVGIDVGTTTTQVIFSRLTLENTASVVSVPRVSIVDRTVVYKSPIVFTPLLDKETINAESLRAVIEKEYGAAGMRPDDISAGAVIITGETARKRNAETVLHSLAGLAGEFVVTTAGSDLESLLAGRGAGTEQLSRERDGVFANLDIGGGTTNLALFRNGAALDTSCLDIGGRHVLVDAASMTITSISPQYRQLMASMGLTLREGGPADLAQLKRLTDRCAAIMAEILRVLPPSEAMRQLITNKDFRDPPPIAGVTFSGGVAASLLETEQRPPENGAELFAHGDIGILQAISLRESALYRSVPLYPARETIRATVVGIGVQLVELSGSTIFYSRADRLPVKNIPVLKLAAEEEARGPEELAAAIRKKIAWFNHEDNTGLVGICLAGPRNPSYAQVAALARAIADGSREMAAKTRMLAVLVENDLAKSLGNALYAEMDGVPDIFCLDAVNAENGDYIDIGKPMAGGRVLPVAVKSLLFGK